MGADMSGVGRTCWYTSSPRPHVYIFYMAGVTCMICDNLFKLQPQPAIGALGRIAIASQHCRQSVAATAIIQSRGTRFLIPTNDDQCRYRFEKVNVASIMNL